jgi:transcriptional regulator with XRE-family HTH domain
MSLEQLSAARRRVGLSQQQAAARLGVSQPYLSLLEQGRRPLTTALARKMIRIYRLSPTALPLRQRALPAARLEPDELAKQLASLGYPGFAWLRARRQRNPAEVLFAALSQSDLETRLTEALPWVVYQYADLDWEWLLARARQFELQNRLGYVTHLAGRLARRHNEGSKLALLAAMESRLDRARLAREDTLCHDSLSEAERRWLRRRRPAPARHWNLLTDLSPEHLTHAP